MSTEQNTPQQKGISMRSKLAWVVMPGLIAALALALSSCGGGGSSSTNVSSEVAKFPPPTAPPDNAQKGGTLTVLASGDVDHIDPGAAYYQFTYMETSPTQRALLSWQPDDTTAPTPDLADGEPTISSDNKTLTFKIKSGIKYSPPLGGGPAPKGDVTSADVKYAIERGLLPGVANGYEGSYLGDVEGFSQAQAAAAKETTKAPDISGIETPDDSTLVFHLTKPSAAVAEQALSLPISAPVPESFAAKYDAENPSSYGQHQVGTGPYYITNYQAGKDITLERNPNWDASTDWRPAYLDKIDIQEGFSDTVSAGKKILTGSDMVNGDFSAEPTVVKEAVQQYPDQLTLTPAGANRYVALNTTKPPFDDLNVRKAVIANADRDALVATRGGPLVGATASHFIPPGIPGFDEAGGIAGPQGSEFDFIQNPKGDPSLAASYMKKAGFPSGKCTGSDCTITMVGSNEPPANNTAAVVKDQLSQLGFKVDAQLVTTDTMYTKFCDVVKNEPQVCPNVGWIKDFNDPQSIMQVPFSGESIVPTNNSNWPLLDNKAINTAMKKAALINDPGQRAQAWGKIDDDVMAQAPAIPWIWDNEVNLSSGDVAPVINQFNSNTDLSFTSLTK
jgi:peptide/nickel transport system substrate-binding protein